MTMDFTDQIKALSGRASKLIEHLDTEEATKNALVMPFIQALGYNVFDPTEVVPEFTADVGTKKGEKVDYAIMQAGSPIILFECKAINASLDESHASQLYRYFSVTDARIAVLTNGREYRFYSDLEQANRMDAKPYLVFDLLDLKKSRVEQLKMVTKSSFDLEKVVSAAGELKYTRGVRKILEQDLEEPSEPFIRYLAGHVYSGRLTKNSKAHFAQIIKRAFSELVRDRISHRLESALAKEQQEVPPEPEAQEPENGIVTTEDELEGFQIVRAIVCSVVDPERIAYRDVRSYFGVLLDDNNRKPICRLRFNTAQKYLGLFDAEKNEERVPIGKLTEIYLHAERLRETLKNYEKEAG